MFGLCVVLLGLCLVSVCVSLLLSVVRAPLALAGVRTRLELLVSLRRYALIR